MGEKKKSLREVRTEKDISQSYLAKYAGVHMSRISLIETENVEPTFVEKIKLSFALGLLMDDIEWPIMPAKTPQRIPEIENASEQNKKEAGDGT